MLTFTGLRMTLLTITLRLSTLRNVNCPINWQGLTWTTQWLSSILAEIISDKPFLSWRGPFRTNQFIKLLINGRRDIHNSDIDFTCCHRSTGRVLYFWIQTLRVWETEGEKQVSNEVSFICLFGTNSRPFIPKFSDTPHSFKCPDWLLINLIKSLLYHWLLYGAQPLPVA